MRACQRLQKRRCPGVALALANALLLLLPPLLVPSVADAALRLELRDLPCLPAEEMAPRIERLLARDVPADADVDLTVTRDPTGDLRVHLQRAASVYDRLLPFRSDDDCAAVPHAVAAVARAWIHQSWQRASERAAALTVPNESAAVVAAPEPRPAVGVAGLAAPRQTPRWRLVAAAGGSSAPGASTQFGAMLGAAGEWNASDDERWGLAVLGTLEAPRSSPLGAANVSVRLWQAAALARVSFAPAARSRLDLLAGPAVQLLDARLSAPSVDRSHSAAHPAAFLMVRWRERLTPHLQLLAALCASARGSADDFYVLNPRADFSVPAARVGGLVGLGWDLE